MSLLIMMLFQILFYIPFLPLLLMAKIISKPYIHGMNLEILQQLLRDGFVYTGNNRNHLRFLQKLFPQIRRSQFKNKSIYYLEDKNKLALKEMMKRDTSRIISFQELSRMSQVFNTNLDIQNKRRFLGKNPRPRRYKIKKFKKYHQPSSKEKQTFLEDFFGRFLHSEVLQWFCAI